MTNPEVDPQENVCETGSQETFAIEILEPRDVPLGGIRAMNVRRTLPQRKRSLIGAWCFLDHYGPDRVSETGGMNVAAHPHSGLQTVSWLFSGTIEHRDSAGFHALVRPGELNLMTAGYGISHSERSTPETEVLHGVQLWVALPRQSRRVEKHFEAYMPPVLRGDGWSGQVFLGSLLGQTSPVVTYTPLLGAEIVLEPHARMDFEVDPSFEHGILVDQGSVAFTAVEDMNKASPAVSGPGALDSGMPDSGNPALGVKVPADHLAYIPVGAAQLKVSAGGAGARILLLGGYPLGEKIVMWWNFVGRSHDEIVQARQDWQAELAKVGVPDPGPEPHSGTGDARNRFGLRSDEPEPPLPAPPLPNARLRPRGN